MAVRLALLLGALSARLGAGALRSAGAPPRAAAAAPPASTSRTLLGSNSSTSRRAGAAGRGQAAGTAASSRKVVVTRGRAKPNPDRIAAMKKVYTLQFVGLDSDGLEPRNPMAPKANLCMVAVGEDQAGVGGTGLSFDPCPHVMKNDKFGIPKGEPKKPEVKMLFQFMDDGRVRHFQSGKCVRRIKCSVSNEDNSEDDALPSLYDLGDCSESNAVRFELWMSRANRADIAMPKGNPLNSLMLPCQMCGPYLMQQVCRGDCDSPTLQHGWTKDQSQTIRPKTAKSQERTFKQMAPYKHGLCGSFLKEDEEVASWWYFHKYDPPS